MGLFLSDAQSSGLKDVTNPHVFFSSILAPILLYYFIYTGPHLMVLRMLPIAPWAISLLFVSAVEKDHPWLSISGKSSGTLEVTGPLLVHSNLSHSNLRKNALIGLVYQMILTWTRSTVRFLGATWIQISRIKRCWTKKKLCWQGQKNVHCAQIYVS